MHATCWQTETGWEVQIVRGIAQCDLHHLLEALHLDNIGKIGESQGKLFLNFPSAAAADQAAKILHGCQLPGHPKSCIPACIKGSGSQRNHLRASSQIQQSCQPARQPVSQDKLKKQSSTSEMVSADCTVIITVQQGTQQREVEQLVAAWKLGGQFASAGAVGVMSKSPLIYVNFGDSAQAAAAVQSFIIAYSGSGHRATLKSASAGSKMSWVPYFASNLRPVDEDQCLAAGVLLFYRSSSGKCEVLLGEQKGRLTLLGGMRNRARETSRAAAVREFDEETADQLNIDMPSHGASTTDSSITAGLVAECPVIWLGGMQTNSKYALYVLDIAKQISELAKYRHLQPRLASVMANLPANFLKRRKSLGSLMWKQDQLEMSSLQWVQLDAHQVLTLPSKSMNAFLAKLVAECQPLRQFAADTLKAAAVPSLKSNIEAAQEAARQEIPALQSAIAALSRPTLPVQEPTAPSDLVTVPPNSREFQVLQSMVGFPLQGLEVKWVEVAAREARFNAWRCTLPSAVQDITQVGCQLSSCAQHGSFV